MGEKHLLISARLLNKEKPRSEKYDIYRFHRVTGEIVNLTNTPALNEISMDWIGDDVLPVSPRGKKKSNVGDAQAVDLIKSNAH